MKAGDLAPEIDWSKVLHAPEPAKYKPSLTGRYTVLTFLPVTPNAKAIDRWNEMVAKFADKPVQFVWIASEKQSELDPFLKEHPVNGWLLIDEKRETARAYGSELGEDTIVDPAGRIVGFTRFVDADQLSAILEGNAVAIPPNTDDDQVRKLLGGLTDGKVRLESEPEGIPQPQQASKPDIAPSYEVHISPSTSKGEDGSRGPDFRVERGFDLKTMVSGVYGKDVSRVELPKALDNDDKFDFVIVLPKEESDAEIDQLMQRAIEKRFALVPVIENRPMDVYVMTAIKGKTLPAKTGPDSLGGGFSTGSVSFVHNSDWSALPPGTEPTPEAMKKAVEELMKHPENIGIASISAGNTTMDEFRKTLEMSLGRPVIDETGLDGVYDIEVQGDAKNTEEFIRNLREQTGLVLTPATRSVEILTMKSLH